MRALRTRVTVLSGSSPASPESSPRAGDDAGGESRPRGLALRVVGRRRRRATCHRSGSPSVAHPRLAPLRRRRPPRRRRRRAPPVVVVTLGVGRPASASAADRAGAGGLAGGRRIGSAAALFAADYACGRVSRVSLAGGGRPEARHRRPSVLRRAGLRRGLPAPPFFLARPTSSPPTGRPPAPGARRRARRSRRRLRPRPPSRRSSWRTSWPPSSRRRGRPARRPPAARLRRRLGGALAGRPGRGLLGRRGGAFFRGLVVHGGLLRTLWSDAGGRLLLAGGGLAALGGVLRRVSLAWSSSMVCSSDPGGERRVVSARRPRWDVQRKAFVGGDTLRVASPRPSPHLPRSPGPASGERQRRRCHRHPTWAASRPVTTCARRAHLRDRPARTSSGGPPGRVCRKPHINHREYGTHRVGARSGALDRRRSAGRRSRATHSGSPSDPEASSQMPCSSRVSRGGRPPRSRPPAAGPLSTSSGRRRAPRAATTSRDASRAPTSRRGSARGARLPRASKLAQPLLGHPLDT